jgi:hypothetical protein
MRFFERGKKTKIALSLQTTPSAFVLSDGFRCVLIGLLMDCEGKRGLFRATEGNPVAQKAIDARASGAWGKRVKSYKTPA